jgi:DNA transposition AAA+ family ATPase
MASTVEVLPRGVLVNPVVKNLCALAARAWKNKWMVTFTAATGVGKSAAVEHADATLEFPHAVIACKQITTKFTILRQLGLEPGQVWKAHGRNYMTSADVYERAVQRAARSPYLLIVDEADRLRSDCFEMLRDLWDDARLPIMFVGNEVLTEKVNRQHERLFRRIGARFEQPLLREAAMRETVGFMGYQVSDEEFELIWRLVGGSPGFAKALLDTSQEIAVSHGVRLDVSALLGGAKYFPVLANKRNRCTPAH